MWSHQGKRKTLNCIRCGVSTRLLGNVSATKLLRLQSGGRAGLDQIGHCWPQKCFCESSIPVFCSPEEGSGGDEVPPEPKWHKAILKVAIWGQGTEN